MQKQGLDALKRMAQMAKNRLRNKVNENDNKNSRSVFKVLYGNGSDIKNKIITREDKKLYEKVKAMMDENEDIFNPLARLIDFKVYNKLDVLTKERYLFELVEKYKKYKQIYYEEKQQIV